MYYLYDDSPEDMGVSQTGLGYAKIVLPVAKW